MSRAGGPLARLQEASAKNGARETLITLHANLLAANLLAQLYTQGQGVLVDGSQP